MADKNEKLYYNRRVYILDPDNELNVIADIYDALVEEYEKLYDALGVPDTYKNRLNNIQVQNEIYGIAKEKYSEKKKNP